MSTVVAIGETDDLDGFALVGATVVFAGSDTEVIDAWRNLGGDVGLVILSGSAAETLRAVLDERPDTLTVAMP